MRPRPPTLLLAAAAQGAEAVVLLAAAVVSAVDTVSGRSYHRSSGIALTVIAYGAIAVVAFIACGLYRVRRWSRTPALLTQLFVGTTGVYLLEGHHLDWGVPTLLLAIAGFVGLLLPPSLRALATGPRARSPGGVRTSRRPGRPPRHGHPGCGPGRASRGPPGSPRGQGRPPAGQEGLLPPPLTACAADRVLPGRRPPRRARRPTRRW